MRKLLIPLLFANVVGCASLPAPSGIEPQPPVQVTKPGPVTAKAVLARRVDRKNSSRKPINRASTGLAAYIAKHYLISEKGARRIAEAACKASDTYRVDAKLLIAVMAVESRFNPYAKSRSDAEGLMQIIPRWHPEKMRDIGGEENVVEVQANVMKGAQVLREYLDLHQHDEVRALQQYNGSLKDPRLRYSKKVLREKKRIVLWLTERNYDA